VTGERPGIGGFTRRELLGATLAMPLARAFSAPARAAAGAFLDLVRAAPGFAVGVGAQDVSHLELTRTWSGQICRSRLSNRGTTAAALREIVLFDIREGLAATTTLYGEGFQMLSQTGGTLGAPANLGAYTDAGHYKMPTPAGTLTVFGAMTLAPDHSGPPPHSVDGLGFASTRRFSGLFRLERPDSLGVILDTEGLSIAPGETWELEDVCVATESSRDRALAAIGAALVRNHPRLPWPAPPTGWCSWYCFGPRVTAQNILDNLDAIATKIPGLTYIQIDDGYQPAMGDWLETGPAFDGDVRKVLSAIKARGFQPAIWIAPFVAEEQSHVFQQHRDWFVKDAGGSPLRSDTVTFGGWRRGPWYVLDGTHPDVQAHFEHVFATMNREWGVTYFKLDANFWGAIHGGRFHDSTATRIEAYRRGMEAILRGAGSSFMLGCNHPIWPSAGLIHGSRSSNDIKRTWERIERTAYENRMRNWQNGLLWWNDPDAVCLAGDLPENEFIYHATAIYATGGMVLSGDDLTSIPPDRLAMLKTLLPPTGVPAVFDDQGVGRIQLSDKQMICVFNPSGTDTTAAIGLEARARVRDVWTGASLGRTRSLRLPLPRRSARLLECTRG
jgi:alpha-galactosidase